MRSRESNRVSGTKNQTKGAAHYNGRVVSQERSNALEETYDEDAAEEEVGLCSDRVESDGHDSHNGERAEPLPHQTNGHRDGSVSNVEDLGNEC